MRCNYSVSAPHSVRGITSGRMDDVGLYSNPNPPPNPFTLPHMLLPLPLITTMKRDSSPNQLHKQCNI